MGAKVSRTAVQWSRPAANSTMAHTAMVFVLLPAYNEEEKLPVRLPDQPRSRRMQLDMFELVVAHANDHDMLICQSFAVRYP